MFQPRSFLIASANEDERILYRRTIARKFPAALVMDCGLVAVQKLEDWNVKFDAAVIHFNGTPEAHAAVTHLRNLNKKLPIVALSGLNRAAEAIAAGVTRFLPAEEWLMLPNVLTSEIAKAEPRRDAEEPTLPA